MQCDDVYSGPGEGWNSLGPYMYLSLSLSVFGVIFNSRGGAYSLAGRSSYTAFTNACWMSL